MPEHRYPRWVRVALPILVVWDLAWRGPALWRAARRSEMGWFVSLLILNTGGLLPMLYLLLRVDEPDVA